MTRCKVVLLSFASLLKRGFVLRRRSFPSREPVRRFTVHMKMSFLSRFIFMQIRFVFARGLVPSSTVVVQGYSRDATNVEFVVFTLEVQFKDKQKHK